MYVIGLRRYIMHDLLFDNLCTAQPVYRQELLKFSRLSIKRLGCYDYAFSAHIQSSVF